MTIDELKAQLTSQSKLTADWWMANSQEVSNFLMALEPDKMALPGMLFMLGGAVNQAAAYGRSLGIESAKAILHGLATCDGSIHAATMGTMQ